MVVIGRSRLIPFAAGRRQASSQQHVPLFAMVALGPPEGKFACRPLIAAVHRSIPSAPFGAYLVPVERLVFRNAGLSY
jgi:hypothetical protein